MGRAMTRFSLSLGTAEGKVHLPALCHLAQVGVSEGAVQQIGMGPWPGCRERHFYLHGKAPAGRWSGLCAVRVL